MKPLPILAVAVALFLTCITAGLLVAQDGIFSFLTPGKTRLSNNLKQMALAMHNYHDAYKSFPPTGLDYPKDSQQQPKPMLSWRVRILPFIDQLQLYNQFNFNEPWDSPTNKPLLKLMPEIYKSPGSKLQDPTVTLFQVVTMPADGAAFAKLVQAAHPSQRRVQTIFDGIYQGKRMPGFPRSRMASILDGTSNSVLIIEADTSQAVFWTKPGDFEFDFAKPWTGLGTLRKGHVNFAMADGSVASFPKEGVSDQMLRDAFFISDGRDNRAFRAALGSIKY